MRYLKTYVGVVSGSFAGREDGYPETKYVYYKDIESLAKEFGKDKDEHYYELKELNKDVLEEKVFDVLEKLKVNKKEEKKIQLKNKIEELQKELNQLEN